MCCHPGFVVPFIEHRQSTFNIIFKVLIFSEWDMNIGFNFKSLDALTPKKRISMSFEAVKPGTDFSLVMKVLDGVFSHYKAVSSALRICCSL